MRITLRYTHKRVLILFAFLALILAVAGFLFFQRFEAWETITLSELTIQLSYPKEFQKTATSEEEAGSQNKRETLWRAIEGEKLTKTPLVTSVSKEKGLRIVTSLTRVELVDNLLRNIERAYPLRFPEYFKLSEKKFDYKDKKAAELYFTYKSSAGEKIKQRLLIIEYDPDTALYVSAQAREQDFDSLNKKYFNRIFNGLDFHQ